MLEYTGEFKDGLGNKITVWAVANPTKEENHTPLTTRAAGFGVVKFNCKTRNITIGCWPRNVNVQDPNARQYPGWPKTIHQEDNYSRKPVAYLPTLNIRGRNNPVVQVIDESNKDIVYTVRINGSSYRPKVFKDGYYTIKVGEGYEIKTFKGIKSIDLDEKETINVNL